MMKLEEKTKKQLIDELRALKSEMKDLRKAYQEIKKSEEVLRQSEEQFRCLADESPNMIFINKQGRIIYANKKCEELMGYSREELYAEDFDFFSLVAPETRKLVYESFQRHLQGEEVESFEYAVVTKHGRRIEVMITTKLISCGNESAILGVVTDITKRKRAEDLLRRERDRAQKYLDIAGVIIVAIDADRKVTLINKKGCEILGYNESEIIGKNWFDHFLPKRLRNEVESSFEDLIEQSPSAFEYRENPILTKNGAERLIAWHNTVLRDDAGKIIATLSSGEDITKRRKAELQIQHYSQELERMVETRTSRIRELQRQRSESEKLAAAGRMAARIAHEINNPLAGIKSSFQLIRDAVPEDHPYHSYMDRIDAEIDRIARIVRQMYILHRRDQGISSKFSLIDTINDIMAMVSHSAQERGISVEIDIKEKARIVTVPEDLLRQILYNLLLNAIEASPADCSVKIEASIYKNTLNVRITNQGAPIPQEIRSSIFEPFFTTKNDLANAGLGLGLSVTKSLVEAMKGEINFMSEPGKDTVFQVNIPLQTQRKIRELSVGQ